MATKRKYDKFAVIMLVMILIASSLIFYAENPNAFRFGFMSSNSGGTISLYVMPKESAGIAGQAPENTNSGSGGG